MRSKDFLYEEVYSDIRQKIMSGHYQPDDRLPGEDELSQEYHASRITIKRALDMLREDGLVRRVQGKGTFVMGLEDMRPAAPMEQRKESRLVGIVLEHVSSPFGLEMMYRMIRLLEEQNYKTCVRFTFGDIRKETEEINDLLSMHICGLIIMPCHDSYNNMTILKLILEHFPVVLVDKQMSGLPVSSIYTDGSGAVNALVHKLRERGAKNAALITIDPSSASSLGDRVEGFYKGLEETGIGNMGELILPRRTGDWIFEKRSENYITAIEGFLRSMDPLPEGIVCTE